MAFLGLKVILVAAFLTCEARGLRQLQQVLYDDFDDFNLSLWKHEITLTGGGNWEFEYYTNNRSNSYVSDGVLYIKPTLLADQIGDTNVMGNNFNMDVWGGSPADACTSNSNYGCFRTAGAGGNYLNPVVSARIRTAESFSFTYGKVEVRAKLPRGDWLWPAIGMLPTDNQYGGWPASGEIDIMESRGNSPSYPLGGYDTFGSTLHFGPYYTEDPWDKAHQSLSGVDLTADFHVYGLIWNETYMGTYFDNESNPVLSFPINQSFWSLGGWTTPPWNNPWSGRGNNAPFDRRYYLIINLACGGTTGYFPDGVANKPWSNNDPHSVNSFYNNKSQWYPTWTTPMAVDSVAVWTYVEREALNTATTPTTIIPSACTESPSCIAVAGISSAVCSIVFFSLGVFLAVLFLFGCYFPRAHNKTKPMHPMGDTATHKDTTVMQTMPLDTNVAYGTYSHPNN